MAAPALTTAPPTPSLPAAADPLAGLRDWHLPGPVAWWPPAPGWWLVAGLILVALGLGWGLWRRRQRRGAAVRAALNKLADLRLQLAADGDRRRFAAGVSNLLRRLALIRYPRERVAGLTGAAWLGFLDDTGGGGGFSQGPGLVLGDLHYRAPGGAGDAAGSGLDAVALADLAARWVRAHREAAP
jgi:hypothetical protein